MTTPFPVPHRRHHSRLAWESRQRGGLNVTGKADPLEWRVWARPAKLDGRRRGRGG